MRRLFRSISDINFSFRNLSSFHQEVSPDVDGLLESAFLKQDELTDLVTLTYAGATDCYLIQG